MRTAAKKAGGTVHNHGGSPGKRLGVKKFSGAPVTFHLSPCQTLMCGWTLRPRGDSRKYHCSPTGHTIPPRPKCMSN